MEFFASAIEKATVQLLTRVATDYNLPCDELLTKYLNKTVKPKVVKPKAPKVPMEERAPCPGFSGKKKLPCKNKCKPGFNACHLHCEKVLVPVCAPCPPQVPAPAPAPEKTLIEHAQSLSQAATDLAESLQVPVPAPVKKKKTKKAPAPVPVEEAPVPVEAPAPVKKPAKKKTAPAPAPVPVPAPAPVKEMSLDERLREILASGGNTSEDEDDEEVMSPGAVRHKGILESQGRSWADYYDDEDEELEEELVD